jgi:hypothetical protein
MASVTTTQRRSRGVERRKAEPRGIERRPPGSTRPLALPLGFTLSLAAFAGLPAIRSNPGLFWSILGAAAVLVVGVGVLAASVMQRRRTLGVEVLLRRPHYLQACIQTSLLLYWGWYWSPVYEAAPLIVAQLVFAYAFDMLLVWSRRDTYTLGFGPFPIILSIQFFLWFKPEWYYLQFLMIAVGFAAKELIRWNKDGKSAHIFNPSSFTLAVFSVGLILTGNTSMTNGVDIARTQFNPPNIYLILFLVGLPGQFLFGVTSMTMSAVVTTYLFGLAYFAATGTYFFVDSFIPVSVFLGMHLLFTDPATAPRTELGRIIFGVLYGLGNVVLYQVLGQAGIPTFYDKLLPVPLMNLSIKLIDRIAKSSMLEKLDPARLGRSLAPRQRNLAYMAVWGTIFIVMSSVNAVGDSHPGHRVTFWQGACEANLAHGCENLAMITDTYCADGSGWACNEVGVLRSERRAEHPELAATNFANACAFGFTVGCQNASILQTAAGSPRRAEPLLRDYPVILRTGKGPLPDKTPFELYTRACDQDWMVGCEGLGVALLRGEATPRNPVLAAAALEKACTGGVATSCSNLGLMYYSADGVPRDQGRGLAYLKKACDLGFANACRWLEETKS